MCCHRRAPTNSYGMQRSSDPNRLSCALSIGKFAHAGMPHCQRPSVPQNWVVAAWPSDRVLQPDSSREPLHASLQLLYDVAPLCMHYACIILAIGSCYIGGDNAYIALCSHVHATFLYEYPLYNSPDSLPLDRVELGIRASPITIHNSLNAIAASSVPSNSNRTSTTVSNVHPDHESP